ncbi:hypothetical protein CRD60_02505 [Bifidobacterium aemilianum]|uniref:Uncharacterized protein n=1 Tax=Bifidobacterium aemilianum TaxID=2493120 RepID=A0A366KAC2_9BIFI|nr:hypothetical protein CRD60_02505 [Bifidobacterium aemilianum]
MDTKATRKPLIHSLRYLFIVSYRTINLVGPYSRSPLPPVGCRAQEALSGHQGLKVNVMPAW